MSVISPQTSFRRFRAMQTGVQIKIAVPGELSGLAYLFDGYRQFYGMESDLAGAQVFLSERMRRGDSVILVAKEQEGLSVGFVQLYPMFSSVRMAPIFILNDLYVDQDWRGRGIGEQLMEAARRHAVQSGNIALELATEKTNERAQRLYEKLGYSRDRTFYHYALDL